jgi:hypothetical protein
MFDFLFDGEGIEFNHVLGMAAIAQREQQRKLLADIAEKQQIQQEQFSRLEEESCRRRNDDDGLDNGNALSDDDFSLLPLGLPAPNATVLPIPIVLPEPSSTVDIQKELAFLKISLGSAEFNRLVLSYPKTIADGRFKLWQKRLLDVASRSSEIDFSEFKTFQLIFAKAKLIVR